ncbi:MAG: carbohydrate ABC transporter permease [Brevinema sp.]
MKKNILYLTLGILVFITIIPFIIVIINATRSHTEILTAPISFRFGSSMTENYTKVRQFIPIWKGLGNTVFYAFIGTILTVYFSTLAAYGFTVYEFTGKKILLALIMLLIIIPGVLGMIGLFDVIVHMKLLNSYLALFLPAIGSVGTIFFMLQFMENIISISLIEQGRIDGMSEFSIFHFIILPIIIPGMATISIVNFIGNWNNLIGPLLFLFDPDKFPLTVMIAQLPRDFASDYGVTYFTLAFSLLPLIIIFLFLTKFIVQGLMAGSIKE